MVRKVSPQWPNEFLGTDQDETMYFHTHQHWIRMAWPLIKLIALSSLVFLAGWLTLGFDATDVMTRRLLLSFFTIIFLYAHFAFLCKLYRYFLYVIVVTDRKIHRIKKTLLVTNDHESIDITMLQDVKRSQCGVLQSIFHYGSLVLEAQETVTRLHFIPRITETYRRILRIRERAKGGGNRTGNEAQQILKRLVAV